MAKHLGEKGYLAGVSLVLRSTARKSMASATGVLLETNPTRFPIRNCHGRSINKQKLRHSQLSISSSPCRFPPFSQTYVKQWSSRVFTISSAYVSGPPILSDSDPKVDASEATREEVQQSPKLISWGLLWSLLLNHKLRLGVSVLTLVGCTTCTLSMPLFSGTTTSCENLSGFGFREN